MKLYNFLVKIGEQSGCHRMPERSFFYKGKQFPVCARCTGGFAGYLAGGALYFFYELNIEILIAFCAIMFLDWFLQYTKVKESSNVRRLITGFFCGIGLVQIYFKLLAKMLELIFNFIIPIC